MIQLASWAGSYSAFLKADGQERPELAVLSRPTVLDLVDRLTLNTHL
jgi:hypothetical protein